MSTHKPLIVFWSKAALTAAGPRLLDLQEELVQEAREIVSQAHDRFVHAIPEERTDSCYICTGNENSDEWKIFVQAGKYEPLTRLPDDHAVRKLRGKTIRFPKAFEDADNEIFARFDDIDGA